MPNLVQMKTLSRCVLSAWASSCSFSPAPYISLKKKVQANGRQDRESARSPCRSRRSYSRRGTYAVSMKLTPASIAAWIVSRPSSLSEAPADGKGGRQPGGQRFLTQARVAHHKTPRGLQKGVEVVVSLSLARASLQLATGDRSRVSCWQRGGDAPMAPKPTTLTWLPWKSICPMRGCGSARVDCHGGWPWMADLDDVDERYGWACLRW
jgi:hypothetical protein